MEETGMTQQHPSPRNGRKFPPGHWTRRRFLQGLGTCIALPAMESLRAPSVAKAAEASGTAPLRMAFCSIPNGVQQRDWFPTGSETDFVLNKTMQSLEPVKSDIQILKGLEHLNATPGVDGPGDHARANATFLTGARAKKTNGSDVYLGVSVDQVAAQTRGHLTRFRSLELSCDAVRMSGNCDSGYSCAYQFNLSWKTPTTPVIAEHNPRLVFERMFGTGPRGERQRNFQERQERQKSLLDFVLEDVHSLQRKIPKRDSHKLDEYLTSVRQIETRIVQSEALGAVQDPDVNTPRGVPDDYGEHMDLMYDMLLLAFQTDSTRVASLLLAHDGSNRTFPDIEVIEGHHYLTHSMRVPEYHEKVGLIDQYYIRRFSRFLQRMKETEDFDGRSLLDNSMIVYGGAISDGNRHYHDNLPVILAGGGGGTLNPGRFVTYDPVPMSNLFVSMLNRFGVETDHFGDSNGKLTNL